jgi:hypothetical protein
MFGRIKDWRRIAMRYDRCAHTFFSAICIAATVIFYLKESVLSLEFLCCSLEVKPGGLLIRVRHAFSTEMESR